MDFTYFFAGIIGAVAGFGSATVFAVMRGTAIRRLALVAVGLAVVSDGLFLINWSAIGRESIALLAIDFVLIGLFSLVGCLLGIAPPMLVYAIWVGIASRAKEHGGRPFGAPPPRGGPRS